MPVRVSASAQILPRREQSLPNAAALRKATVRRTAANWRCAASPLPPLIRSLNEMLLAARGHAKEGLRGFVENNPRDLDSLVPREAALLDHLGQDAGELLADEDGFGVGPLDTVRVGEKAHLLIEREHIQALGEHLPNRVGKEVVPPVAGQAQVGQLA